ncbi:hypothetical protein [Lysobacter capsici]|uniref:hypothetical protein n=1 Tax=Lysobacter capsici TaxID=435897 RepID=UPI001BFFEC6F|nr:hypothetical protein [Lysobacter capsici]QWF19427.1 hypothetical protein KME82_12135 [Lysobacter capsici]
MAHRSGKWLALTIALAACAPGWASAANPPNPVCLNQAEFIEQGRQTVSPAAFKLMYDPAAKSSFLQMFKALFEQRNVVEQAAQSGDAKARAWLGVIWAQCRLDGFEYAPEKLERGLEYLNIAQANGDSEAPYLLAMYRVLGWDGQPASLLRAYPLMVEAGKLKPRAQADGVAKEPGDDQKSSAVYTIALQDLLEARLSSAKKLVNSPSATPIKVIARYPTCEKSVQLEPTPETVNREAVLNLLNGVAAMLPVDGLDCSQPALRVPLTFGAAAKP